MKVIKPIKYSRNFNFIKNKVKQCCVKTIFSSSPAVRPRPIKKGREGSTASDWLMTRCLNNVNNCILKQTKHIATKQLSFSAVAFRPWKRPVALSNFGLFSNTKPTTSFHYTNIKTSVWAKCASLTETDTEFFSRVLHLNGECWRVS